MRLSFVILTRNSARYISDCLDSVFRSLPPEFEREVFVVDNGSTDGTRELLQARRDISPVLLPKNRGTTYSRNLALRRATGDFVVILDSDILVTRVPWRDLLAEFRGNVGLVAPRLTLGDGQRQHSVKKFPTLQWRLSKLRKIFLGMDVKNRELYEDIASVVYPDTAISAFWVISRKALDSVGFLDERIFYSPEDVDYCVRVWKAGLAIRYFQDAEVIHYTQQIANKRPFSLLAFSFFLNFLYYFGKHGYFFSSANLEAVKAGVLGRHEAAIRASEKGVRPL